MPEFPRLVSPIPKDAPQPPKERGGNKVEGRWIYRDADGHALKVKLRFPDSKRGKAVLPFTLWEIAPNRFQWFQKDLPTPRPLYGRDRLAAKPNAPVLICEGEKTADAAQALFPDWVAITSGAATSATSTEWAPLTDGRVVIWPDHDEPGRMYANEVQRALQGIAARVAVVSVPDSFPQSWDLADPLPEGIERAHLQGILDVAASADPQPWEHPTLPLPPEEERKAWVLGDVARMLREDPPPVQWLVEELIPAGQPGLFAARAGAGKSMTSLLIALGLASGRGVLGRPVSPDAARGVLYVGLEDDESEFWRRLRNGIALMREEPGWSDQDEERISSRLVPVFPDRLACADFRLEHQWKSLRDLANAISGGCGLIVLDTFARLSGGDENSAKETRPFLEAQAGLAQSTGATVMAIHHVGKGNDSPSGKKLWDRLHPEAVRGSSAIEASARFILTMASLSASEAERTSLDPDHALAGGYVALHLAKMSQGEKGSTILLDRRGSGQAGAGFLCPHPDSERVLANLKSEAALQKLNLRDKVLIEIAEAGGLDKVDQPAAAALLWPDAKSPLGQWQKQLSDLRKKGWLSDIHLTDLGRAHAETLGFIPSARKSHQADHIDNSQHPRGLPPGNGETEVMEEKKGDPLPSIPTPYRNAEVEVSGPPLTPASGDDWGDL